MMMYAAGGVALMLVLAAGIAVVLAVVVFEVHDAVAAARARAARG